MLNCYFFIDKSYFHMYNKNRINKKHKEKNMIIKLNQNWNIQCERTKELYLNNNVPCSVYKALIDNNKIPDPYYRENEYMSTSICDDDYTFTKKFSLPSDITQHEHIFLKFNGIDTLSSIYLNGTLLGNTNNMHRTWEFDVKSIIKENENLIEVKIKSPNKYIAEMQKNRPIWGVDSTMAGYPYLRKAHCMFGWDWGPKLPDMGIWRDVCLEYFNDGRIKDIHYTQIHSENSVKLNAEINCENYNCNSAVFEIFNPQGEKILEKKIQILPNINFSTSAEIKDPMLWWANGYGEQNLYTCKITLINGEKIVDQHSQQIGLRTLTISQDDDEWGKEFCFILNGKKIFAMGANYIPEDQILPLTNIERTKNLLRQCKNANYNFIRVWGGGIYPDDCFYDFCDENGIIIWQDFMFACSAYLLTDEFKETVSAEIADNIIRLRNHPSLGLWCGNNEIESAWEYWGLPNDPQAQSDYLTIFEEIIPEIVKKYSPEIFYWPSSPSSGGGFKDASSNHAGDMHYWDVWHNFKPIEAFREYYYRFCSEYGFESLPSIKTIKSFADEELGDFDLMSPVMDAHQKCVEGNEKIMFYLAQMVRYPYTFQRLVYSSQLVQADCIRSNVEHMRRARGRCMGSAYWQVNDSNPVISWSSIDYFGRWKGLHYYAKRFYAPVLLSIEDKDINNPIFNISNETMSTFNGTIHWTLRNNKAEILEWGEFKAQCPALSAKDIGVIDISKHLKKRFDKRTKYLEYRLVCDNEVISHGTTLFVRPKEFNFLDPQIQYTVKEHENCFKIQFTAKYYAKSVCLDFNDCDGIFSDNWFDIHGNEPIEIIIDKNDLSRQMTKHDIEKSLTIQYN